MTDVTNTSPATYANNGSYTIDGGVLTVNAALAGTQTATATVTGHGGSVVIDVSSLAAYNNTTLNITSIASNSHFVLQFRTGGNIYSATESYNGTTTTVVIRNALTNTYTINIAGNPFQLTQGSSTNLNFGLFGTATLCFLAGVEIETPHGVCAVEEIGIGTEVVTQTGDVRSTRAVTWAGSARCVVQSHLPDDEAGYPVRVIRNALAEGVPYKDMLITPEHCLFLEGRFVPVRMLVNGRSIAYDKSITSYEYYHIETADHSVIVANGALTESYLDTGNRRAFLQRGDVVSIGNSRNLTWDDAACPLDVSRAFVEPLYRHFAARSETLDNALTAGPRADFTQDAGLHLVTDAGHVIRASADDGTRMQFAIPPGVEAVRLVSKTNRPFDFMGPFVDDRRSFGVAIAGIDLLEGGRSRALDSHLTDAGLEGWNALDSADARWTSGNALLPLGAREHDGIALLTLDIFNRVVYPADQASEESIALTA